MTAYNPNGQPATEAENVEADSRLKQRLNALGLRHFRVTGTSKDGAHQEPGFGIVAENREQISELAREKQRLRHSENGNWDSGKPETLGSEDHLRQRFRRRRSKSSLLKIG